METLDDQRRSWPRARNLRHLACRDRTLELEERSAPRRIRLIQEREARLAVLDNALARGLADAETGRVKPAAEVFARLKAKYQAAGRPAE